MSVTTAREHAPMWTRPITFTAEERAALSERIKAKTVPVLTNRVEDDPFCEVYTGKWENGKGHKKIGVNGHVYYVHRLAYQLAHPDKDLTDLVIDHKCRRRDCCNPSHLEDVSMDVNTRRGNGAWVYDTSPKDVWARYMAAAVFAIRPRYTHLTPLGRRLRYWLEKFYWLLRAFA